MRRLTVWDGIGSLLKTNHLSVREFATIVHQRHRADSPTDIPRASLRLVDLATVNLDLHGMIASKASEKRHLHIRDNWRGTNNETFDTDKLVGIYERNASVFQETQHSSYIPVGLSSLMLTDCIPNGRILYTLLMISAISSSPS